MSVEVVYCVGDERLAIKLGQGEAQAISRLSDQFPAEDEAVFGVRELGESKSISAQALVAAAERVVAAESSAADVGVVYSFEGTDADGRRWFHVDRPANWIGGIDHSLWAGGDRCTMQALHRNAEMRVIRRGEIVDLRGRESVQTDNGLLRIKRSGAATTLASTIRSILDFAASHGEATVEKVVM